MNAFELLGQVVVGAMVVLGVVYVGRLLRAAWLGAREAIRTCRAVASALDHPPVVTTLEQTVEPASPHGQVGVDWFPLPPKDDGPGTFALAEMLVKRLPIEKQQPVLAHLNETYLRRARLYLKAETERN